MDKFQEVENILNELNQTPQQKQQDKCKDCNSPPEDLPDDGLIVDQFLKYQRNYLIKKRN